MGSPVLTDSRAATVAAAAKKWGVPPEILWGVFGTESGFGSNLATSSAGAKGYFQFVDSTARSYHVNPYSLSSSADGAAHYLHDLKQQHGSWDAALNAYSGGGGQTYVDSVLAKGKTLPADLKTPLGTIPLPGPDITTGSDPLSLLGNIGSIGGALGGGGASSIPIIGPFIAFFTKSLSLFYPGTWVRIGKVLTGVALVGWGFHALLKATWGVDLVGGATQTAKKATTTAAEIAAVVPK